MAAVAYPAGMGFQRWHAWREYSSGDLAAQLGPLRYLPGSLSPVVRTTGVLLWRGRFTTPVFGPRDVAWYTIRAVMEQLDGGINHLTLVPPADQRSGTSIPNPLAAQPIRVEAPERGSRGEDRGWTVEWVQRP